MAAFFSIVKSKLILNKQLVYTTLFLVTFLETASAQEILRIESIEQANEQIENYINIYVDTTNSLDLSQILIKKEENLFSPLKKFTEKRSSKNTYWLYFSIDNNSELDYPIGLHIPRQVHWVDIYYTSENVFFCKKTGFYMVASKNDEIIPFSNIIQIKDGKRVEYYLKIKNINDELPNFSLKIINLEKAIKQNNRSMTFDGFANGMMFLMIMYGMFLFFSKKDLLYLYYSIYIILLGIYYFFMMGYGYQLFPELPRRLYVYAQTPTFLGFIFYIQFLRLILNTTQPLPKWDKFLRLIQIILVIECVRIPIFVSLTNLVFLNFQISNIVAVVLLICSIAIITKLFSSNNTLNTIIGLGSLLLVLGLLIGTILLVLLNMGGYLFNKIGIIAELLVFTYGISFRYSLIEADKQKYQKQLIIQLSENAELHEKVNRELADKVKERTHEIEKQRDHIKKINTDITDSINYAQYIQSSILPKTEKLESYLGEYFVLYEPKDIVSGDFYWVSNTDNKIIIAAADSTGHGVPGAFMSMLGIALLNEIVNKEYITHPGVILRRLRKEVINSMQQKGERGESKDGMDIALCTIDRENMKLQFSGANNPLYLIRKADLAEVGVLRGELTSDYRLYEIKGDPMPIGINDRMDNFTFHEIDIFKGDLFYMFTDGFPDQFGGPENKKYGYRQFREQVLKNNSKTMPDQKTALETSLNDWKRNNNQIDDILVVGFRIS